MYLEPLLELLVDDLYLAGHFSNGQVRIALVPFKQVVDLLVKVSLLDVAGVKRVKRVSKLVGHTSCDQFLIVCVRFLLV